MLEIRVLGFVEAREQLHALAAVLVDCVEGGASVSFMAPFSLEEGRAFFEKIVAEISAGERVLLGAFWDGALVGTVQLVMAMPPNQPHRADVAKLLVQRSARGRGVAQRLMQAIEEVAVQHGKTLLVLDTVTGGDGERLYNRLGWTRVGVIPNYALFPDGRRCDTTVFYKAVGDLALSN